MLLDCAVGPSHCASPRLAGTEKTPTIHLGSAIGAVDQEALVRGWLVLNVIQGTDKGVASAKALGSDKRVSMWQLESHQGVVIVNMPAGLEDPDVRKRMLQPNELGCDSQGSLE